MTLSHKTLLILFWTTTTFIFLFEGVMPGLTGFSQFSKDSIKALGYPEYFVYELVVFKVIGALALILPQVPNRIKEWAYAGFGIVFISAFVAHFAIGSPTGFLILPLFLMVCLIVSYISKEKLNSKKSV
jgi:DoxX-like family